MRQRDDTRAMLVTTILVAFVLGAVFGALATRLPRRALPMPGHSDDADLIASPPGEGLAVADSMPGNGTAEAPPGYPIKGNERSGIYHEPGGISYARTIATTFYRTPEAAEAAGLRHSKT